MKDVIAVTLIFEDGNIVPIPARFIGSLLIEDFRTRVYRLSIDSLAKVNHTDTFAMEVSKDFQTSSPINLENHEIYEDVFGAMTDNKLVSVVVSYAEDDSQDVVFVPYTTEEDEDYTSTYISSIGHFYISASTEYSALDYFAADNIEDEDLMNKYWALIGVTYEEIEEEETDAEDRGSKITS